MPLPIEGAQDGITRREYAGPPAWSDLINARARAASGDVLVFLDAGLTPYPEAPDDEADRWLMELVCWASRPEVGVVGPKIVDRRRRIVHAGGVMGLKGVIGHVFKGAHERQSGPFGMPDWYRNYQVVGPMCQAIRRALFDELGGMPGDEPEIPGWASLCRQALAKGYRNVYTPSARLLLERPSHAAAQEATPRVRAPNGMRVGDPFFNPNLSRVHAIPTVGMPAKPPM
jgi:hypothetical protein